MNMTTTGFLRPVLFAALGAVVALASVSAGGKADDYAHEPVSGRTHWSYDVDLNELEEGKYNLVVRAVDEAGNVRLEGPYDFQVDPETDIPAVAVAHPQPNARVGRLLPIIGTARDDDAVARVEVSINGGSWRPATGTEAWSAVLDAGALGDGPHRMDVKSVDVNGLESPPVSVPFIVDTSAPVGGVDDPVSGAMVSGKATFVGTITDPNGIERLELSRDGAVEWEDLRFSKNKESGDAAFDVDLDSRDLDDGPVVWWFRATDAQGSASEVPFLFFVDNAGPEVTVELPASGDDGFDPVPGDVFLAGTVRDQSGTTDLTLTVGKQDPVSVPLSTGNPWWTWPLDLSGIRDKKVDVLIRAVDGAGNVTEQELEIPLDAEADRPSLSLEGGDDDTPATYPVGSVVFFGTYQDDDGPGYLTWSVGDMEGRVPVDRIWRLELPELSPGDADLVLVAEDAFGTRGEPVERSFRVAPEVPIITLDEWEDAGTGTVEDWSPGRVFSAAGGSISGSVISDAGRSLVLSYVPAGGEETELALKDSGDGENRRTFAIPIKKGGAPGPVNFILRAFDGYGGESILGSGFYRSAEADESGAAPDPRAGDDAVNLPLPLLRERDGAAILRPGQPLEGWTSGASASGAEIRPESPYLTIRARGTSFTIESAGPGLSDPVRVVLPDGSASPNLVVLTDLDAPRWEMDSPTPGEWSSGTLSVSGTIVDAGGLAEASWSLGDGSSTPITFEEKGDGRYVFLFDADISGRPNGVVNLTLRARDASGNDSEHRLPVMLDSEVPRPVLERPSPGTVVGARSTLIYALPGDEVPEDVAVSVDGQNWISGVPGSRFAVDLDLAGYETLPETLAVRVTDRAGNVAVLEPTIGYDPVSDRPEAGIQTPADESVVRGPMDLAGLVADDDAVAAVYWRIDGGEWNQLEGAASFRVPLPLDALADGSHLVEVYAEDAAGNVGDIDSAWFRLSRREAQVTLDQPEVGTTSRGLSVISGTAEDDNGIAEVWVSFDNGHTFARARGSSFEETGDADSDGAAPEDDGPAGESPAEEMPAESAADDVTAPTNGGEPVVPGATDEIDEPVAPIVRNEPVEWRYAMDTRVLDDGVHTLLIKVVDGAGDEAILAGLLDVDNAAPLLALGRPEEGSLQTGSMVLEGRVLDQGGLKRFHAVVERAGETLIEYDEIPDGVFHIPFEFDGLEPGEALLRVEAEDVAGNLAAVSRSFVLEPGRRAVRADVSIPVEGESVGPFFTFAGSVANAIDGDAAILVMDGTELGPLTVDERGRFVREFGPDELTDGDHVFRVDVVTAAGERSEGAPRRFSYRSTGPWVLLEGYPPGTAVGGRPLLTGRSGFQAPPPPEPNDDNKDEIKAYERALKDHRPDRVEVSLDGGLSFERARGSDEWEFRIETDTMGEGDLPVLVRSRFPDGWVYARTLLRVDKTLPDLRLNESVADGRFNGEIELTGTAGDDRNLDEVTVSVRPGGQNRYKVPSFIEGMYLDAAMFGATWFNTGLGATFFDDNVKLQVSLGWSPELVWVNGEWEPARVSGTAVGATLLANVVYLPLGYYFGPSWEALSFSLAIGANFTYFTNFTDTSGGVMSSVVVQMETPKIEFLNRRFITYVAPYVEGRLWFFSSDVSTTPRFTGSVGVRLGLL